MLRVLRCNETEREKLARRSTFQRSTNQAAVQNATFLFSRSCYLSIFWLHGTLLLCADFGFAKLKRSSFEVLNFIRCFMWVDLIGFLFSLFVSVVTFVAPLCVFLVLFKPYCCAFCCPHNQDTRYRCETKHPYMHFEVLLR